MRALRVLGEGTLAFSERYIADGVASLRRSDEAEAFHCHAALRRLVAAGYARKVFDGRGYDRWQITAAGRAYLAEVDEMPTTDEERR